MFKGLNILEKINKLTWISFNSFGISRSFELIFRINFQLLLNLKILNFSFLLLLHYGRYNGY